MRRSLFAWSILLSLAACKQDAAKVPEAEDSGPRIATSIEDYALPVDKSDQITAIDAATGDSAGMPRDGGAVVRTAKPEASSDIEAGVANSAAPPTPSPPLVVPPAPTVQPATPSPDGSNERVTDGR